MIKINNTEQLYYTKYKYINLELFEVLTYSLLSFCLPIFLGHPQWFVGSIVNFFLAICAIRFEFKKVLPLIFFPSLGVFIAGVLFSQNTSYILYFLPIIWIANALYVISIQKLVRTKRLYKWWYSTAIVSLIKAVVLFSFAILFVFAFNFPKSFLIAMGPMQLLTATIGIYLALIVNKLNN
ncbi:MAG: hypothetical protein V1824_01235 [archaeon]